MISVNQDPTDEEKRAEVIRVVQSNALHNAPMLQKLMEFVGTRAFEFHDDEVNEWTVAAKVFGRTHDFDPTADATVRTSVYRLRNKLREYYAGEGKLDPIVIEIPKGRYVPVFTKRTQAVSIPEPLLARPVALPKPAAPTATSRLRPGRRATFAGMGFAALLVVAGLLLGRHAPAYNAAPAQKTDALLPFWKAFAGNDGPVIVAYSNAELLQTDTRHLMRYDSGPVDDRGAEVDPVMAAKSGLIPEFRHQPPLFYENGYTGTGEVQAVFSLTHLLSQLGIEILVKRVGLLTIDDLKNHNIVLLGSCLENRAINEIRLTQGLAFEFPSQGMWAGRILDKRSAVGFGQNTYAVERDPKTRALRVDYAIMSVAQGITPNRKVMLLGGLTTSGTEGAAEFVTSESQISGLLRKLAPQEHPGAAGSSGFFETLLEVRVVRGLDPINTQLLIARPL